MYSLPLSTTLRLDLARILLGGVSESNMESRDATRIVAAMVNEANKTIAGLL